LSPRTVALTLYLSTAPLSSNFLLKINIQSNRGIPSGLSDIVNEFKSFQVHVDMIDPHADSAEMQHEYGVPLISAAANDYDAIIVAVNHKEYIGLNENYFKGLLKDEKGIFVDVKGIYKDKIHELEYWSL
jgi:UDP-N-acetyl-D-galactosamine dehydrogenase